MAMFYTTENEEKFISALNQIANNYSEDIKLKKERIEAQKDTFKVQRASNEAMSSMAEMAKKLIAITIKEKKEDMKRANERAEWLKDNIKQGELITPVPDPEKPKEDDKGS